MLISQLVKLLGQIQTSDVECQFQSQRVEEIAEVIGGLPRRVSNQVDSFIPQLAQCLCASLIAGMKGVGINRGFFGEELNSFYREKIFGRSY